MLLAKTRAGLVLTRPLDFTYEMAVRTARKFLRMRDFLHYGSQLIPERRESETWSLAWAYIREIDDVIDTADRATAKRILVQEWEKVTLFLKKKALTCSRLVRDYWLAYFLNNLREHYSEKERRKVLSTVTELYQSALIDVARRGKVLSEEEMTKLLKYKAVAFFKLYFTLGRFKMEGYEDKLAELLGLALGLLDDFLDFLYDLKVGYINLTARELAEASTGSAKYANWRQVARKRGLTILRLLMRARQIAHRLKNPLARKTVLRLTEAFAAPILEGRFIPGATYLFKGGKIILKLLPEDEIIAYEVGHKIISTLLSIPQLTPTLVKLWTRLTTTEPHEFSLTLPL